MPHTIHAPINPGDSPEIQALKATLNNAADALDAAIATHNAAQINAAAAAYADAKVALALAGVIL